MNKVSLKSTGEIVQPMEMPKHFNVMYQFLEQDNDIKKRKDYTYYPFGFKIKKIHENKTVDKDNYIYVLISGSVQLVKKSNLNFK